mmetsp:Transcript_25473/g.28491  ORF Transcript_25473/g.28491 Transcript_25473/m.28491 type:complete len:331 (+) Transcript_25473:28-1020(+)
MPGSYHRRLGPVMSRNGRGGFGGSSNSKGETASVKNACAMYGLTQEDVASASPPIPCQYRSCHGNSYAIVKLSDIAKLKSKIDQKIEEDKKNEIIDKHGQKYYDELLAKEEAEEEEEIAAEERDKNVNKLTQKVEVALKAASLHGIADDPIDDGMTITKTNAKKDWWTDVDGLSPIDSSKKMKKYHLSDVIGKAIAVDSRSHGSRGKNLAFKIQTNPEKQRLFARYLLDQFHKTCQKYDDDESIIKEVYENARKSIVKRVQKKEIELKVEKESLKAFDNIMALDGDNTKNVNNGMNKVTAKNTKSRKNKNDGDAEEITPSRRSKRAKISP